jgi:hypothetical protein
MRREILLSFSDRIEGRKPRRFSRGKSSCLQQRFGAFLMHKEIPQLDQNAERDPSRCDFSPWRTHAAAAPRSLAFFKLLGAVDGKQQKEGGNVVVAGFELGQEMQKKDTERRKENRFYHEQKKREAKEKIDFGFQ